MPINEKDPIIVQFNSGKYAIRKPTAGRSNVKYQFLDFKYLKLEKVTMAIWWTKNDRYFEDCKVDTLKEAEEGIHMLNTVEYNKKVAAADKEDMGKTVKPKQSKPFMDTKQVLGTISVEAPKGRKITEKLKLPKFSIRKWFTD